MNKISATNLEKDRSTFSEIDQHGFDLDNVQVIDKDVTYGSSHSNTDDNSCLSEYLDAFNTHGTSLVQNKVLKEDKAGHIEEKRRCYIQDDHNAVQNHMDNHNAFITAHEGEPQSVDLNQRKDVVLRAGQHSNSSNSNGTSFICGECGKTFAHSFGLYRHMRTHTGEKPYECSQCGKTFCRSDDLYVHMRLHTGEKPFECEECGDSFAHRSSLQMHMSRHTGERPFKCDECGKCFSKRNLLNRHLKGHTGIKPFECSVCGKGFVGNSMLQRHMLIHTRVKPFGCEECGKTFSEKVKVRRHMKTHTGEKPYSCDHCGKGFIEKNKLVKHLRVHT